MVDAVSRNDIRDIINTLIAENAGEGPEAMRYVAETILNRAEQRGLTPAQVVRQPNQYTGFFAPGPGAVRAQNDPAVRTAAEAAWTLAQGPDDPTGGANHYYAPGTIAQPGWARNMTETANFGGHRYLTDRPVVPRGPISPSPATASKSLNNRRTLASNAQSYAGQERGSANPVSRNLTRPGGIAAASNAAASTASPALQSALNRLATSKANPQAQATQTAARRAALSIASNQTNAGREGTGGLSLSRVAAAPTPAPVDDRVTARNAAAVRQLPSSPLPSLPSAPMTRELGAFPSSLAGFAAPALSSANPLVAAVNNANGTNRLLPSQNPPALFGAAEVPGLPRARPSVASALSVAQPNVALPRPRPSIAQALVAPQAAPVPMQTIGRSMPSGPVVQAVVRGGSTPSLPTLFRNPVTGALTNAAGANFGTYRSPQQMSLVERLTGSNSSADNVDRPWSTSQ